MFRENHLVLVVDLVYIVLRGEGGDGGIVSGGVLCVPLDLPLAEGLFVVLFFDVVGLGVVRVPGLLQVLVVLVLEGLEGLLEGKLKLLLVVVEFVFLLPEPSLEGVSAVVELASLLPHLVVDLLDLSDYKLGAGVLRDAVHVG